MLPCAFCIFKRLDLFWAKHVWAYGCLGQLFWANVSLGPNSPWPKSFGLISFWPISFGPMTLGPIGFGPKSPLGQSHLGENLTLDNLTLAHGGLGPLPFGPKYVWAHGCLGPKSCLGPWRFGPKDVWAKGCLGPKMFGPKDVWAQDFIRLNYVTNDSYSICGYRMPLLIKTPSRLERHFLGIFTLILAKIGI